MSGCGNCSGCNHESESQFKNDHYLIKLYYELEKNKREDHFQILKSRLIGLTGIKELELNGDMLEILYDDRLISPDVIRDNLE